MNDSSNRSVATCVVCNQKIDHADAHAMQTLCDGHRALQNRGFAAIIEINHNIEVDPNVTDPLAYMLALRTGRYLHVRHSVLSNVLPVRGLPPMQLVFVTGEVLNRVQSRLGALDQ